MQMTDEGNELIEGQAVESPAGPDFRKLDPRVIRLWQWTDLIAYLVLLGISTPGLIVLGYRKPELAPFLAAGWILAAALFIWLSIRRPRRAYAAWRYRIDDRVLETRSGIIFQRTRLLPLRRVQHVDLERGPIERRFGLASLVLFTAGTHSAKTTIEGLDSDDAVALRDHLIAIGGDDAV